MSDINVTIVAATNVSASILNSDVVNVEMGASTGAVNVTSGPCFGIGGMTSLLVQAGANITVTTTEGAFTVVGRDPPVTTVQGRTGSVVLTRADLTAAALTHTHATTDIVGLTAIASSASPVQSVQGRTGNVTILAVDLSDFATEAAKHGPVSSVAGKTGTVTLVSTDITDFTAASSKYGPVSSVNGKTGTVVLTVTDITAAPLAHTHTTTDIVGITAIASSASPVQSVQGRTGNVVLVATDLADFATEAAKYGPVSSVAGRTGTVTLVAADITDFAAQAAKYGPVSSVNGRTGTVVLTHVDLTAAAETHTHSYAAISHTHATSDIVGPLVTSLNGLTGGLSLVAGSNVTVSTSVGNVILAAAAGPQGPPGSFGDPQLIQPKSMSYTLKLADVGTLLTFGSTATSPITVTVPNSNSVPWVEGSHIDVARIGDASVTVSGSGGAYVIATPGPSLRDVGSGGTLVYLGTNAWLMVGDLT